MDARSRALLLLLLTSACTESRHTAAPVPATGATAAPVPATAAAAPSVPASEIAAPNPPPAPGPSGWAGKWKRWALPSMLGDLTIRDVTAAGFHFDVSVMTGAHQGGLEGDAAFTPEGARFDGPDRTPELECSVTFVRKGSALLLEQQHDCIPAMGFGVSATGEYHPEGEVRTYPTTFDCAGATSPVDRAVCEHAMMALADIGLGARDSARIRREVACSGDLEIERCVAGAYRRRFAALRGGAGRGFDLAGMRRATRMSPVIGMVSGSRDEWMFSVPAPAWHELELYVLEQLPRERYGKLMDHRLENEHIVVDATGIALQSCALFCCECMGSYVRVEARGAVWAAFNGSDEVVLTPKTPGAEPAPLKAWLAEFRMESAERLRVFE